MPSTEPELTPVQVVEKVGPAVVTVINEQPNDDATENVPAGSGSGFILDEEGHIVTNQHVVDGGVEFVVVLADGREEPATLIGADANADVAVLKIDSKVPAVAKLGDSPRVPIVLTGAMRPFEMVRSDALQNLTEAIFATGVLEPGVYCVVHGRALAFPGVSKDRERRTFIK